MKTIIKLIKFYSAILLCFSFILVSCGGGDSSGGAVEATPNDGGGGSSNITLPSISSTSPVNGAQHVAVTPTITATFNKTMDSSTITPETFILDSGATGTVSYNADTKTALLIPESPLSNDATYIVTLTGEIRDSDGNSLTAYSWSFITESAEAGDTTLPTVTLTTPANDETEVSIAEIITATFSEAMDASTMTTETFTLKNGSTSISGEVTYDAASHKMTLTPAENLDYGTLYTATISTGVTDTSSNAIAEENTWSFTTLILVPPSSPPE